MKGKYTNKGIHILKSLGLSYIITMILVLIVSLLLVYTPLKESNVPILNTIILISSIAIGSIYMAIKVKEKGWLNGGIIGILYFLLLALSNHLFIKSIVLDIYSISRFFVCLISGIVGGIIGVNLK